jgi:catechol 2,3-dioxygenase-like lactoylglutathione lyase family enzyme
MILSLDHLVLTVADLDSTRRFYCDILGMTFERFGEGRQALHFGTQKINLHIKGKEFEPKAHLAAVGTADLCFIIEGALDEVAQQLITGGIDILEGPVKRTGASGPITSLYVRDPDLNLIELSTYNI